MRCARTLDERPAGRAGARMPRPIARLEFGCPAPCPQVCLCALPGPMWRWISSAPDGLPAAQCRFPRRVCIAVSAVQDWGLPAEGSAGSGLPGSGIRPPAGPLAGVRGAGDGCLLIRYRSAGRASLRPAYQRTSGYSPRLCAVCGLHVTPAPLPASFGPAAAVPRARNRMLVRGQVVGCLQDGPLRPPAESLSWYS